MRFRLVLALLAVPFAAFADDRERAWCVGKVRPLAVGDRIVCEGRDTNEYSLTLCMGENAKVDSSRFTTSYRFMREILAVTEGRPTKERIKIERWRCADSDGAIDECLEGKTVIVTEGAHQVRGVALEDGEALLDLTRDAQEWVHALLERREVLTDDLILGGFVAEAPVRAGERWTLEPDHVRELLHGMHGLCAFEDDNLVTPAATASGALTRLAVDDRGAMGHIEVAAELPTRELRIALGCGKCWPATWTQDGKVHVRVEGDVSLEPEKRFVRAMKMRLSQAGRARATHEGQFIVADQQLVFESEVREERLGPSERE